MSELTYNTRLKQPQIIEFYEWLLSSDEDNWSRVSVDGGKFPFTKERCRDALSLFSKEGPGIYVNFLLHFKTDADAVFFKMKFE